MAVAMVVDPVLSVAVVAAAVAKAAVVLDRVDFHPLPLHSAARLPSHLSTVLRPLSHRNSVVRLLLPVHMARQESPWILCQQSFDKCRLISASVIGGRMARNSIRLAEIFLRHGVSC